jgi:DNA mismatch repair protein MutL
MAALEQAYTSYMPPEKFPTCVLFITINPSRVDVNVHPAKLEVKFSNEKPVFEAIYYTVRTALENNVTRPAMQLDVGAKKKQTFGAGRVSDATVPVRDGKPESLQKRQLSYDLQGSMQPQPQARMTAEEYRQLYAEKTPARETARAPQVFPKYHFNAFHRHSPVVFNSIIASVFLSVKHRFCSAYAQNSTICGGFTKKNSALHPQGGVL